MVNVYVIKSLKTGVLYVGISEDLDRRLKEHNTGKSKFTKGHLPWIIIYTELYPSFEEARKREKYFKSAAGKKALQKILRQRQGSLPE